MNSGGTVVIVWSGNGPSDSSGVALQQYMLGLGNGMSSNETAYDRFDANAGLAEELAQSNSEQLAAFLTLMQGATGAAATAPNANLTPTAFTLTATFDNTAVNLPRSPAPATLPVLSSRTPLAARVVSDEAFADADWLDNDVDHWRLDEPAATPYDGPVDTSAELQLALAAVDSSDSE
jgi:hypothetical protein